MSESFLSRWSRRKHAEPEEVRVEDEAVAKEQAALDAPAQPAVQAEAAPHPELPPVESLTPEADFTPFMKPEVPLPMRNAALKKLFADPHFNVMDGLDIYIDDYTKPDPIPEAMLRSLVQSKALRLFEDEEKEEGSVAQVDPEGGDAGTAAAAAAGGPEPIPPPQSDAELAASLGNEVSPAQPEPANKPGMN
jgi:hypothetical protein